MDFPTDVTRALDLALELKAHELVVLDLRGISTATGVRPGHIEGIRGGRWVLLDYIDFIVHVLHPEARIFYQLEDLWGDAPRWDVSNES